VWLDSTRLAGLLVRARVAHGCIAHAYDDCLLLGWSRLVWLPPACLLLVLALSVVRIMHHAWCVGRAVVWLDYCGFSS
jgi:hypothetical protein